jgi:hypothetical protein
MIKPTHKFDFDARQVAGTTDAFQLGLVQFDSEGQRWTIECQIGEEQVTIVSEAGADQWYVIGYPEVELPPLLVHVLAVLTHQALIDWHERKAYSKVVGAYPKELTQ